MDVGRQWSCCGPSSLFWPDYSLEPRECDYQVALCRKYHEGLKFSRFFSLQKEKATGAGQACL